MDISVSTKNCFSCNLKAPYKTSEMAVTFPVLSICSNNVYLNYWQQHIFGHCPPKVWQTLAWPEASLISVPQLAALYETTNREEMESKSCQRDNAALTTVSKESSSNTHYVKHIIKIILISSPNQTWAGLKAIPNMFQLLKKPGLLLQHVQVQVIHLFIFFN